MSEAREPGFYWVQRSDAGGITRMIAEWVERWNCFMFVGHSHRYRDWEFTKIGPRIPNAETIEKLWAVAHAMKRIPQCKKHVPLRSPLCVHCQLNARIEELAAIGPLPEEKT